MLLDVQDTLPPSTSLGKNITVSHFLWGRKLKKYKRHLILDLAQVIEASFLPSSLRNMALGVMPHWSFGLRRFGFPYSDVYLGAFTILISKAVHNSSIAYLFVYFSLQLFLPSLLEYIEHCICGDEPQVQEEALTVLAKLILEKAEPPSVGSMAFEKYPLVFTDSAKAGYVF